METKQKITKIVDEYKRLFKEEFLIFISENAKRIDANRDKFASIKQTDYVERKIVEYPTTLYTAFKLNFTDEDWSYIDSKDGIRWFVGKYPEFSGAEKI